MELPCLEKLALCRFNTSLFPKPLSCPWMFFFFLFSPFCSHLLFTFQKIFQLHNFQSQGHQLGAIGNRQQHQNHLLTLVFLSFFLFFSEMRKEKKKRKKSFDRNNYKALENKVNHCGRMPEVDEWREGNVSTASAICFLCCELFFHPSSSLFPFFPPPRYSPVCFCHIFLSIPFFAFSATFLFFVNLFFFFIITIFFPSLLFLSPSFFSSHLLSFLSKILFVRCQRSGEAECELRESVITNNTKQKRLILRLSQRCSGSWENWCRTAALDAQHNSRGVSKVDIVVDVYIANPLY